MSLLTPSFGVEARPASLAMSASVVDTLVIAIIASALSLLFTGFVFGIENNLFHLPVVAGLYNEPQFQDDAFIQSLRYFASGVWVMLSDTQRYFARTDLLFLALDCVSRWLAFLGFLACASLLGVVTRRDKIVFALLAATTPFLVGFSSAGTGGLLIGYFTHSEMANGPLLLSIFFAVRGRYAAATIFSGITFFINAFMAVWLAPLLIIVGVLHLLRGETTFGALLSRTTAGALISVPIVFPALRSILSNPELGKPPGFDFIAYLHEYYPGHSLIDAIPLADIAAMFAVMALGAAALWRFGASSRALGAVYAGAILLYLIGMVLPRVTGSPFALNIQLLRSGTVVHLVAGVAALALATNWLSRDRAAMLLPGALIVLSLAFSGFMVLAAIPVILASSWFERTTETAPTYQRRLGYAALALVALVLTPMWAWQNFEFNAFYSEGIAQWTAVGNWARRETPETAIFIVPPRPDPRQTHPVWVTAVNRAVNFEFLSHRRIWVDWRRGAAAMWTPSYYRVWHERMSEMADLNDHAARLAYASRKGIDYVVELCEALPSQDDVVFRTERLCVSSVRPAGAS